MWTGNNKHIYAHTCALLLDDENNKIEVEVSVVRGKCTFVHLDIKSRHIDIKNMYSCDIWGLLMLLMLFLIGAGDVFFLHFGSVDFTKWKFYV